MVTEQLVQLMAEQPSLLQAFLLSANAATVEEMPEAADSSEVNGEENKMEATSLLTLLLDSADSRVAHGNESEQPTSQESQQNDVDFEEVLHQFIPIFNSFCSGDAACDRRSNEWCGKP